MPHFVRMDEWERSRRVTDTWAVNKPCWASMCEFGWEGFVGEEILLSSYGLKPPRACSLAPATLLPPLRNSNPPPPATHPKPTKLGKGAGGRRKILQSSRSSRWDHAVPHRKGKDVKGKHDQQQQQQKRREELPALEGDAARDLLLGAQVFVPYRGDVCRGVVTSVVGGWDCWWHTQGKRRCFGGRGICCRRLMPQG